MCIPVNGKKTALLSFWNQEQDTNSIPTTSTQHRRSDSRHCNAHGRTFTRRNKTHPDVRDNPTLSLFSDDMVFYGEHSTGATRKPLEPTDEFYESEKYKSNTHKPLLFPHASNSQLEISIRNRMPR